MPYANRKTNIKKKLLKLKEEIIKENTHKHKTKIIINI